MDSTTSKCVPRTLYSTSLSILDEDADILGRQLACTVHSTCYCQGTKLACNAYDDFNMGECLRTLFVAMDDLALWIASSVDQIINPLKMQLAHGEWTTPDDLADDEWCIRCSRRRNNLRNFANEWMDLRYGLTSSNDQHIGKNGFKFWTLFNTAGRLDALLRTWYDRIYDGVLPDGCGNQIGLIEENASDDLFEFDRKHSM